MPKSCIRILSRPKTPSNPTHLKELIPSKVSHLVHTVKCGVEAPPVREWNRQPSAWVWGPHCRSGLPVGWGLGPPQSPVLSHLREVRGRWDTSVKPGEEEGVNSGSLHIFPASSPCRAPTIPHFYLNAATQKSCLGQWLLPLGYARALSAVELNIPLSSNLGDPFQNDPFAEQQTASAGKSLCWKDFLFSHLQAISSPNSSWGKRKSSHLPGLLCQDSRGLESEEAWQWHSAHPFLVRRPFLPTSQWQERD